MNNYTIARLTFQLSFAPGANYYYDINTKDGEIWGVAKTYEDAVYKVNELLKEER
jgi:hypothetical protein